MTDSFVIGRLSYLKKNIIQSIVATDLTIDQKEAALVIVEREFMEAFGSTFHCKSCAEIVSLNDGKCINPKCRRDATNDS